MADFECAYAPVKQYEGGYCNVVGDSGGETYAGIARKFFPKWIGWSFIDQSKIRQEYKSGTKSFSLFLSKNKDLEKHVLDFYRKEWWDTLKLESIPQEVANEIFEQAINTGKSTAVEKIQKICNAMNFDGQYRLFEDLIEDGLIGIKTIEAINSIVTEYGSALIVSALNSLQASTYIDIASKNRSQRKFIRGWLTRT